MRSSFRFVFQFSCFCMGLMTTFSVIFGTLFLVRTVGLHRFEPFLPKFCEFRRKKYFLCKYSENGFFHYQTQAKWYLGRKICQETSIRNTCRPAVYKCNTYFSVQYVELLLLLFSHFTTQAFYLNPLLMTVRLGSFLNMVVDDVESSIPAQLVSLIQLYG